jgi:hypothetical protein
MLKKHQRISKDSSSNEHNTRRENIESINFNPLTKSSNITQVMKQLDNYDQEKFTLSNCITTFKLPKINSPIYPIFSNTITNSTPAKEQKPGHEKKKRKKNHQKMMMKKKKKKTKQKKSLPSKKSTTTLFKTQTSPMQLS